jgi:DNA polymerase-1
MLMFKSLEVVAAARLSGDKTLMQEILDKEDIHGNNQKSLGLPSRLIAKIFVFRLIYGGSAYSYANDSDFAVCGLREGGWQDIIDKFYAKYWELAIWHQNLIKEAQTTGRITIPSGRFFPFEPDFTKREPYPITKIKNYPVQGFGADLVKLARINAFNKLRANPIGLLCSSIHDSLVVDTEEKNVYNICTLLKESIEEVPAMCQKVWGYNFQLPLTCEVQVGLNKSDMKEVKV